MMQCSKYSIWGKGLKGMLVKIEQGSSQIHKHPAKAQTSIHILTVLQGLDCYVTEVWMLIKTQAKSSQTGLLHV